MSDWIDPNHLNHWNACIVYHHSTVSTDVLDHTYFILIDNLWKYETSNGHNCLTLVHCKKQLSFHSFHNSMSPLYCRGYNFSKIQHFLTILFFKCYSTSSLPTLRKWAENINELTLSHPVEIMYANYVKNAYWKISLKHLS